MNLGRDYDPAMATTARIRAMSDEEAIAYEAELRARARVQAMWREAFFRIAVVCNGMISVLGGWKLVDLISLLWKH